MHLMFGLICNISYDYRRFEKFKKRVATCQLSEDLVLVVSADQVVDQSLSFSEVETTNALLKHPLASMLQMYYLSIDLVSTVLRLTMLCIQRYILIFFNFVTLFHVHFILILTSDYQIALDNISQHA